MVFYLTIRQRARVVLEQIAKKQNNAYASYVFFEIILKEHNDQKLFALNF